MFSFYKNIVLKFSGIMFYTVQGGDGSYERVEPNFVKIGQNIKIMRIRKGVTQSELAKKLGISQTHMSNLEHGRVSVNLKVLLRLSHYFSCGVDALLGLTLNTEVKPQEVEDKYTAEELLDILKVLKKQVI